MTAAMSLCKAAHARGAAVYRLPAIAGGVSSAGHSCVLRTVNTEFGAKVQMGDDNGAVDLDVDIVSMDDVSGCSKLPPADDPDATESSSSFGDTLSGSEDDGMPSEFSDIEVDSPFCHYPPYGDSADLLDAAASENTDRLLKKKKVTDHWRKYISPVMWRCQWLELRMKDLQSQVAKYDKELSIIKHEKELQTKIIELDCSSSRSVPFSSQYRRKPMKRRRRKKNELKMDTSSYISNHPVLSYFEKTEADDHSIEDNANLADDNTKGDNDVDWLLGIGGGDNTAEQILLSIQSVQDRVSMLRSNLKEAMANNKGITLKGNTWVNGTQSSNCSPGKGKGARLLKASPQETSDRDMEDSEMPDSTLSSYGEASNMDIFEGTVNPLSLGPQKRRGLRKSSEDVLIENQAAEELGYQNLEDISHPSKRVRVSMTRGTRADTEDVNVAPVVGIKRAAREEGPSSFSLQGATLKPRFTGKRKERGSQ